MLLDVNALLALGWVEHEAHARVVQRLTQGAAPRWATCPITQLGFIRISSTNGIFSRHLSPRQAQAALTALCQDKQHHFLDEHLGSVGGRLAQAPPLKIERKKQKPPNDPSPGGFQN